MAPGPAARISRKLAYETGPRWGSALRRLKLRLTQAHADIRFEGPVRLGPGFSLFIPGAGQLVVGPNVEFRHGFRAEIHGDGRLTIGEGTVFTYYVLIQCSTLIEIGRRCQFGQSTIVVDGNHRFRDTTRPMLEQGYDFRHIQIGDDVAITSKCTIMADIGAHSFIGANSVVTRDIPPYSLAVGAPARVVESFQPPPPEAEPAEGGSAAPEDSPAPGASQAAR